MLFGSDYPFITPERWLADFSSAGFREEVQPKVLLENARRVLRL
jgi:predicted TIM-barrel fold metal-dependent hydrolase